MRLLEALVESSQFFHVDRLPLANGVRIDFVDKAINLGGFVLSFCLLEHGGIALRLSSVA
jgi:hypothetical protein